jgi:hypothetical protein
MRFVSSLKYGYTAEKEKDWIQENEEKKKKTISFRSNSLWTSIWISAPCGIPIPQQYTYIC